MAKKYYDGDITLNTDWGGDESTGNLPVLGEKVQKVIKDSINSKVGYVGYVEKIGQGFYVLCRDEEVFKVYETTVTEDKPFGDLEMDGINGRFDAPFNYKMNITLITPESGYMSKLVDSTNNVIKFKAETLDSSDSPVLESMTITYKVKTEGGVESTYTAIYDGNVASQGIEYNLDGKLGSGINHVTITAVGMNTGVSAMRRITYRLVDISFKDRFDIAKRYQFANDGTLSMNIGYDLKGIGETKLVWYIDGSLYETNEIANLNPNLSNMTKSFYFNEKVNVGLTPGVHTLQVAMLCTDTDSNEEFKTPIYYREFIIEKTPTVLETPYIVRRATFDYEKGFIEKNGVLTIYNAKQYENVLLEYAAYYNGKNSCLVKNFIQYGNDELEEITSEELPLVLDGFSNIQKQSINLNKEGIAEIITRAYHDEEYYETITNLIIQPSDMNITTVEDSVVLYLNAFGRSNNADGKEVWEYKYTDEYNNEKVITTKFSKNEYVVISTYDINNNVIPPYDATEENSLVVDTLPTSENFDYKYLIYNNDYYIWDKEFDWSDTSGWSDNKLKLAKGNSITIDYTPFGEDKVASIKSRGATFEFEFETTNVYNDDAVICRICGKNDFAPGISIYASGAELVISRAVESEGENAGYTKAVSTKYKAEESNRISFVISADEDSAEYRNRILSIYVNGEYCGAHNFDNNTRFGNDSKITFRGSDDACVNISSIKMYSRALSSNEILNNYIYYRNDSQLKASIYKRNDIVLDTDDTKFDSAKLLSQLPVMTFYQRDKDNSLDDIHQEKKNKKLLRFFDVVYIDIQNPDKNFLIKNAYVTPQGTSSMNYPVKNLRLYTGKKDSAKNYYSRLYVGSNIFLDGSHTNLADSNINPESEVTKRKYAFKDGSIPVNCWTLKADFAESSSSHNTGTSRFWNNALKSAGLYTKAQLKAEKYKDEYPYDIRTAIDGFPIVVFYQALGESAPRFEGKYNFNNDKSTEDVFGFTGGIELDDQEVQYFYIGKEMPIIHSEGEGDEIEYTCSFEHGGYTEHPTVDSPLYVSKYLEDGSEEWYMLRGVELLDNPKMECWELLNSVNEIALFKTMKGFGVGDDDEKVGIVDGDSFDEAFESRYPDCGDYYHTNSLRRFGEWLVSCRYLDIDSNTGSAVPFNTVPDENYHRNDAKKLSICSLSKKTGTFTFDFPGYNFYREVSYNDISSKIKAEGYQQINIPESDVDELNYIELEELPASKVEDYEYVKCGDVFYTWMPSNLLTTDTLPEHHETSYDFVKVGEKYYAWLNIYNFSDYHTPQWVDDNAFNRALKFSIEKYDHIEMDKMAAYYIYLMRFGGVDQTVKNSMLTTEGPATNDPNSTLPSLWYFINYDNDTILGVKNDGRLVFDPYITRETKDGTGYVYAGRESTLWNNLEADVEFMNHVTTIDNRLAEATGDTRFALSYSNALREYDVNQSDKWCERIYNQDAERKYIDTFVKGWTQKYKDGDNNVETHVYENYLYDVQGSRSAHRKWWLGRRFNVFDSRFCNTNFRNSLIKFRSTNLPAGSSFIIKSGEPIFYAWGHDNSVTEMTPQAIQPGETYTFTTKSAFNIGSYLELMGSANISSLDLRDCVGALTELDITGCYSSAVGTKLKELHVGDHTRNDLVNISNTNMKFSGLANASKIETIDFTNIRNLIDLDGLNTLLNIREIYAKGTSVANFTFADGANVEHIELPTSVETLSLTRSSSIDYNNIIFENGGYGKLNNLTIDNCSKLMNNANFTLQWISTKTLEERTNLKVNLQGINWFFDITNYQDLFLLENVGTAPLAQCNIRGNITINSILSLDDVVKFKKIFGNDCFKEGSKVYIKAETGLYIDMPTTLWEGTENITCQVTTVGTTLSGTLNVFAQVTQVIDGEVSKPMLIESTNGIITMDTSNIERGTVTLNIAESANEYEMLFLNATYRSTNGNEIMQAASAPINKRKYPTACSIVSESDSYNVKTPVNLGISYQPTDITDTTLQGRGLFSVKWEMIDGSNDYQYNLALENTTSEICQIQAPNGFDGIVTLQVVVTRDYDESELCRATKTIEFTNPDTIITELSNKPLYDILVKAGIIKEDETGFGKLTKQDAMNITMEQFVDVNGNSIFANNTALTSFMEFQYFNNSYMGQMPVDPTQVKTPVGMFSGCTNLTAITFSVNFRYTNNYMFARCSKLKHIYGTSVQDENGNVKYNNLAFVEIGTGFASGCTSLETCLLSPSCEYIGEKAFYGCSQLREFFISTNSKLKIVYSSSTNPFQGCPNITFTGSEYGSAAEAAYKVKDGACYEIDKVNNRVNLIRMGKDTQMSQLVNDKEIYAYAFSMEGHHEDIMVVPNNVVFNGNRILQYSNGTSIEFTRTLVGMYCDNLLSSSNFVTYKFSPDETIIPTNCFDNVSNDNFTKYVVPEGIKTINKGVFDSCSKLTEIVFPSTLETIVVDALNYIPNLKTIVFKGAKCPVFNDNHLYGIMLENIMVYPEYYDEYKNNLPSMIQPLVTPIHLYKEGYVRIIKDGDYLIIDENNTVTVGGLTVEQGEDFYMKYSTDEQITDLTVTLNGEVVGSIDKLYTTIYLGDNSSLYTGNGLNFRNGVYNEAVKSEIDSKGWFYDKRYEGIRSKNETNITLSLPEYAGVDAKLVYGQYTYESTTTGSTTYVKSSANTNLFEIIGAVGYNQSTMLNTNDGVFKFEYKRASIIKTGMDGVVINEIGDSIYSDPEIPNAMNMRNEITRNITVILNAPVEIPNSTYVTVSDGKAYTFRKYWNNEPLVFVLPIGYNFTVTASDFITENGKEFKLIASENVQEDSIIELMYTGKTGMEIVNNVLCYSNDDYDWYIHLNKQSDAWGKNVNIQQTNVDEVLLSDADGFKNTNIIAKIDETSICAKAQQFEGFGNGIVGYIPSYIELEIFATYLPEINTYLRNKNKKEIFIDNCWTSESFNENKSWTSNGECLNKDTVLNYYVFGKKITL